MQIPFGRSAYKRSAGNLAEFRLLNMFVEASKADEKGIVLQSRPGLSSLYTIGSGPVVGMFAKSGVLSGDLFAVSGSSLFRGQAALGTITGTGTPSFAASATQLLVTRGQSLHLTDGGAVSAVAFPDDARTIAAEYLGGFFYVVRADTQRIYFSAVLDGEDWQALDFFSAERKPDPVLDILTLGEEMVALGTESVEFFQETGDADAPLARVPGRTLDVGVLATGCARVIDGALVWVANDFSVRTYDGSARRLSDPSIDERIEAADTVSCFAFSWQGHVFFGVRLDGETLIVDAASGEWFEGTSLGFDNLRINAAAMVSGRPRLGDSETGQVFEFGGYQDGDGPLERLFTAGKQLRAPLTVHNVEVEVNVGRTELLSGDPMIEIRASRDAGATWGAWRSASIGRTGQHRKRARINRWGMFDSPGMLFECRCTSNAPFRVSGFFVNETGGGRAR